MSEEAVQLARASVDAFNRGDLDWLLEHINDDFELDWTRSSGPLAGIYRGRDGLTEFLREQWETFESFVMVPSEFIDRGRHVVVPNTVQAQGRNGIEVSAEANHIFTLEPDGRVARVTLHQVLDEALAAAVE
ncbi:MAG TPA: nuclear transport factor 2 family protein [Thermoleophilaceae bacterium]